MRDIAKNLVNQLLDELESSSPVPEEKRQAFNDRVDNLAERLILQAQLRLTTELQELIRDKEQAIPPPVSPIITRNQLHTDLEFPKRTYVPFTITAQCPKCGATMSRDLSDDYLLSPTLDEVHEVGLYHETDDEEDHELIVKVVLGVTLKLSAS